MLTNPQKISLEKLFKKGSSPQDNGLSEGQVRYIIARCSADLKLSIFDLTEDLPEVYSRESLSFSLEQFSMSSSQMYETILERDPDTETFIACLAQILRARLKFQNVLESQSLPTMDQVGPRSILQVGLLEDNALASHLVWRKWLFDIDNRAAQDTGYLFEPIIAGAIGGVPYSHRKSPIKRASSEGGRQVDAIKGKRAYEFKIRITIAASGQGRWKEEIAFPRECVESGYQPVLIVLDPTVNPKLSEIKKAYESVGGEAFIGDDAWDHLRSEAGATMGTFLYKYIEHPMNIMVGAEKVRRLLLPMRLEQNSKGISISVGQHSIFANRHSPNIPSEGERLPDDSDDFLPGIM